MLFSFMFFSTLPACSQNIYDLLIKAVKYADDNQFDSVWTPERHFDPFGAIFPNPAITSAAISTMTKYIKIRAGSLVTPLHNTIRIVEDWAMVDNLSNGRVGISFAPGWNINDFVLYPERYENRRDVMFEQLKEIRRLWEGEPFIKNRGDGNAIELFVYPSPIQKNLPIWITSVGSEQTFYDAASVGANILTHLIDQDQKELSLKINLYRTRLRECGFDPSNHIITLMLHTFINPDQNYVLSKVREPLLEYMRQSIRFCTKPSQGLCIEESLYIEGNNAYEELLELKLNNYLKNSSLIGSSNKCKHLIEALIEVGVDEIACLLDFGIDSNEIMRNLTYLNDLKCYFSENKCN